VGEKEKRPQLVPKDATGSKEGWSVQVFLDQGIVRGDKRCPWKTYLCHFSHVVEGENGPRGRVVQCH